MYVKKIWTGSSNVITDFFSNCIAIQGVYFVAPWYNPLPIFSKQDSDRATPNFDCSRRAAVWKIFQSNCYVKKGSRSLINDVMRTEHIIPFFVTFTCYYQILSLNILRQSRNERCMTTSSDVSRLLLMQRWCSG